MRTVRTAILASAAMIAVAGLSGVAAARDLNTHVMTVEVPGGGVAEIRYTGDVPPQVVFGPAPTTLSALMPFGAFFGSPSPFAELERLSAAMDREAASLMRQAEQLARAPGFGGNRLIEAGLRSLPPGTTSYTMVSTWSGNGVCSQSVEITSPANGGKPRVVSHSSGNCGSAPNVVGPIGTPTVPPPTHRPDMIETGLHGNAPYPGLVREASWQH
ncbi:MAG: hypothetical protein JO139_06595 [Alphaproteobacteria bacterium]|nr:hypothetical protein [Alphaproteobacteria bacterium]